MDALIGLAWLSVFQTLGEIVSRYFAWPIPGPVIGMLLLFIALFAARVRQPVIGTAQFLLQHLSLLFVPVGVGAIQYFGVLSEYGVRLMIAIILSTWIGLAVTAAVLHLLRDRTADTSRQEGSHG